MKAANWILALSVLASGPSLLACSAPTDDAEPNDEASPDGDVEQVSETSDALRTPPSGPCGVFVSHEGAWDSTWMRNCTGKAKRIHVYRAYQLDAEFCIANGATKYLSDTWRYRGVSTVAVYTGTYCPA